ncbi:MAG: hypothetical protein QM775_12290 [Pirellulales bacterium]
MFGLFAVLNWLLIFNTLRTKGSTSLIFPFVSGPLCALFCWLSPVGFLQRWSWVPLLADLPLFLGAIFYCAPDREA